MKVPDLNSPCVTPAWLVEGELTDLYESTYHELVHLYPRLVSGGILLIDDYPTEHGCVKAVEVYFAKTGPRPFLSRIHTQGRIAIKP